MLIILLLILLIIGKEAGFYKYRDGSNQPSFQERQSDKSHNSSKGEKFTEITVKEDKIYLNKELISFKDLRLSLRSSSDTVKIKLIDDKAINRVFNEVKALLDEGKFPLYD